MNGNRHVRHFSYSAVLLAALALAGCAAHPVLPEFMGGRSAQVDDASITAGVKAALVRDPQLTISDLDVDTEQGVVRLSGFVGSADSVAAAASVTRTVNGVKSVRNDLRLK